MSAPPPASSEPTAPNAARFGPLPEHILERWSKFCTHEDEYFIDRLGMAVEELRPAARVRNAHAEMPHLGAGRAQGET